MVQMLRVPDDVGLADIDFGDIDFGDPFDDLGKFKLGKALRKVVKATIVKPFTMGIKLAKKSTKMFTSMLKPKMAAEPAMEPEPVEPTPVPVATPALLPETPVPAPYYGGGGAPTNLPYETPTAAPYTEEPGQPAPTAAEEEEGPEIPWLWIGIGGGVVVAGIVTILLLKKGGSPEVRS